MAFRFKRKESVRKAIRRLGLERVEDALECLKDFGHGEAIHDARKNIKKARAVLRLVRAGIPRKEFRRVTKLLRGAAKRLDAARDAYVKVETLRTLARHFEGQFAAGALRQTRAKFRTAFKAELARFTKEKTAKAVERLLRQAARELQRLEVRGKGWKALAPGAKTTYARGRQAYHRALKDSSADNFHSWRKRAKDLWYQVTLLRRAWPEQIDALASELEKLGDYLGDDHDLVVLRQAAEERCARDGQARELETLDALIGQRQSELRGAALALGARLYAEKPSAFCDRLAGFWQVWRGEKRSYLLSLKRIE